MSELNPKDFGGHYADYNTLAVLKHMQMLQREGRQAEFATVMQRAWIKLLEKLPADTLLSPAALLLTFYFTHAGDLTPSVQNIERELVRLLGIDKHRENLDRIAPLLRKAAAGEL